MRLTPLPKSATIVAAAAAGGAGAMHVYHVGGDSTGSLSQRKKLRVRGSVSLAEKLQSQDTDAHNGAHASARFPWSRGAGARGTLVGVGSELVTTGDALDLGRPVLLLAGVGVVGLSLAVGTGVNRFFRSRADGDASSKDRYEDAAEPPPRGSASRLKRFDKREKGSGGGGRSARGGIDVEPSSSLTDLSWEAATAAAVDNQPPVVSPSSTSMHETLPALSATACAAATAGTPLPPEAVRQVEASVRRGSEGASREIGHASPVSPLVPHRAVAGAQKQPPVPLTNAIAANTATAVTTTAAAAAAAAAMTQRIAAVMDGMEGDGKGRGGDGKGGPSPAGLRRPGAFSSVASTGRSAAGPADALYVVPLNSSSSAAAAAAAAAAATAAAVAASRSRGKSPQALFNLHGEQFVTNRGPCQLEVPGKGEDQDGGRGADEGGAAVEKEVRGEEACSDAEHEHEEREYGGREKRRQQPGRGAGDLENSRGKEHGLPGWVRNGARASTFSAVFSRTSTAAAEASEAAEGDRVGGRGYSGGGDRDGSTLTLWNNPVWETHQAAPEIPPARVSPSPAATSSSGEIALPLASTSSVAIVEPFTSVSPLSEAAVHRNHQTNERISRADERYRHACERLRIAAAAASTLELNVRNTSASSLLNGAVGGKTQAHAAAATAVDLEAMREMAAKVEAVLARSQLAQERIDIAAREAATEARDILAKMRLFWWRACSSSRPSESVRPDSELEVSRQRVDGGCDGGGGGSDGGGCGNGGGDGGGCWGRGSAEAVSASRWATGDEGRGKTDVFDRFMGSLSTVSTNVECYARAGPGARGRAGIEGGGDGDGVDISCKSPAASARGVSLTHETEESSGGGGGLVDDDREKGSCSFREEEGDGTLSELSATPLEAREEATPKMKKASHAAAAAAAAAAARSGATHGTLPVSLVGAAREGETLTPVADQRSFPSIAGTVSVRWQRGARVGAPPPTGAGGLTGGGAVVEKEADDDGGGAYEYAMTFKTILSAKSASYKLTRADVGCVIRAVGAADALSTTGRPGGVRAGGAEYRHGNIFGASQTPHAVAPR